MYGSYQIDRRVLKDRRRKPTFPFSTSSVFGSRGYVRRREDRELQNYVDAYNFKYFLIFVVILMLSVADGFMTFYLISDGAKEMNPVMDFFLELGFAPFLFAKYTFTATGLTCLLVHKDHSFFKRIIPLRFVLISITFLYCTLLMYEIALVL